MNSELVKILATELENVGEREIQDILSTIDLSGKVRPATRVQLTLRRLAFTGTCSGEFPFYPGVNVIRAGNFKGKSTILQLVKLCLTGKTRLKPDMSSKIATVALDFTLNDTYYRVSIDRGGRHPKGSLITFSDSSLKEQKATREFKSAKDMSELLEDFFCDQLGLEALSGTQKSSSKENDALLKNRTSYDAYFKGLYLDQETGYQSLVTDVYFGNAYTKTVGMLLGCVGLHAYFEADAALAMAKNDISKEEAFGSRKRSDRAKFLRSPADISRDIEQTTRTIDDLKLKRTEALLRATSTDMDERLAKLTNRIVQTRELIELMSAHVSGAERAKATDESTAVALEEALAGKQYFSTIMPHHCPVCEIAITRTRTQTRQAKGQCLLCTEQVNPEADRSMLTLLASRLQDVQDSLKQRESSLRSARKQLRDTEELANQLAQEKARLQTQIKSARADSSGVDAQIERESRKLGKLEAERAEVERAVTESEETDKLRQLLLRRRVLESLVSYLRTVDRVENEDIKIKLASRILQYAERTGLAGIQSLRLDAQLRPAFVQNANEMQFSDLAAGEKVRFVLAFSLALALAPALDGKGALHPGLLLVDSPAKEEMVEKDFGAVVSLLTHIEETHAHQVQVIVATTHRGIREATTAEKARVVENDEDYLFS